MPIAPVILQRRLVEVGRIRLGQKGPKGQPQKLTAFRFTSPHERHIAALADLYGGTATPWDNAGKREHEVVTDARAIPVVVVPGGFSQWMETWSGGGCVHRCDGVQNVEGDTCDVDSRDHKMAKPTTRLSVMLRDLEALGTWRLESHGWNAAAELPGMVDIAGQVGRYVRASLTLAERVAIKDGKTSRFVVPSLDLEVTPERLTALTEAAAGGPTAIGSSTAQTAIAAVPEPAAERPAARDWAAEVGQVRDMDALRALGAQAQAAGAMGGAVLAAFQQHAAQLEQVVPDEQDSVDGDVVDEPTAGAPAEVDVNGAWQQLLTAAGGQGLDINAVDQVLADLHPDTTPGEYTGQQMLDAIASLPRTQAGAA